MAKVQKTKAEVKSAIQRKSAYSLPNNPTDSGYKADDIRKAFYKPIIDITNSALTEIDRVVDEINRVLEYSAKSVDFIESASGIYYHGSDGIVYSFANNKFSVSGYEGNANDIAIPYSVFYQGEYYPVVAIATEAFKNKNIKSLEISFSVTAVNEKAFYGCTALSKVRFLGRSAIGTNAFTSGKIVFSVPKEYLSEYNLSLADYAKKIEGIDTIINNANDIVVLYRDKLTKVTGESDYERLYSIGKTGVNATKDISPTPIEGKLPIYLAGGTIQVGNPKTDNDATPKSYLENRLTAMGAKVSVSIDPTTYIVTVALKNEKGDVLNSGTVDLPLESMILGASYANGILTLNIKTADGSMDNNPIEVNISDLIDGLVSESTFESEVDRLDGRIDESNQSVTALENEVDQKEIYGYAAFHAEESETAKNYTKGGGTDKKFKELETISGNRISLSIDRDYKLTISLENRFGLVLSKSMVDLPIESLITKASYSSGKLMLTFQSGDKTAIDISSLIAGLVSETRKINGKNLSSDIYLTAEDVGAYAKNETWNREETKNLILRSMPKKISDLQNDSNFVLKEDGKGLSSNDYTDNEKEDLGFFVTQSKNNGCEIDKLKFSITDLEQSLYGYILDIADDEYLDLDTATLNDSLIIGEKVYPIADGTRTLVSKIEGKTTKMVQLLDKESYIDTNTYNGITLTNNSDGSFTVNGTLSTAATSKNIIKTNNGWLSSLNKEHKYLLCGCPTGGNANTYSLTVNNYKQTDGGLTFVNLKRDMGMGIIFDLTSDITNSSVYIYLNGEGKTYNLTFKPQLFDLTAMYGAGNEPTTVEQFKKDFPDFYGYENGNIYPVKIDGVAFYKNQNKSGEQSSVTFPETYDLHGIDDAKDYLEITKNDDDEFYTLKMVRSVEVNKNEKTVSPLETPIETNVTTTLAYEQVTALRYNGGLIEVNGNTNKKYVRPTVKSKVVYRLTALESTEV